MPACVRDHFLIVLFHKRTLLTYYLIDRFVGVQQLRKELRYELILLVEFAHIDTPTSWDKI